MCVRFRELVLPLYYLYIPIFPHAALSVLHGTVDRGIGVVVVSVI